MSGPSCTPLPSPLAIQTQLPLAPESQKQIALFRQQSIAILKGADRRIALILGPCSIHHIDEALEYAARLKELQKTVAPNFFLILRAFLEKPRSQFGWKGLLYDPHLDGSDAIAEGIRASRKFLLDLAALGVPAASELLDPLAAPYYSDLLTWGVIGARTAASQPHRQLASTLPFPVGFKNTIHGELEPAIYGAASARRIHSLLGIDLHGHIASIRSQGNPYTHLILRGSHHGPNADRKSVETALALLKRHHLEPMIGVDCSHGNSGKDLSKQRDVFKESLELARSGMKEIRMMMLESYLKRGSQPLGSKQALAPGLSVTDPCLSWDDTAELLHQS